MRTVILLSAFFLTMPAVSTVLDGNAFLSYYDRKNQIDIGNFLNGYLAGQWDALEITNKQLTDCVGSSVRMSQLVDTVGVYLKENPQVRHFHPNIIIEDAVSKQFNCPK